MKEKKRLFKEKLVSYLDFSFKVFLLILSAVDLFGFLPASLDILTKLLTAALLFYFWDKLNITKFMFGKGIEWLDKIILASFYILVVDTYVRIVQTIDLSSSFVIKVNSLIGYLPFAGMLRKSFMFVYDVSNNPLISTVSVYAGFISLFVLVVYLTFSVTYGPKSVFHSVSSLLFKNRWKYFAQNLRGSKEKNSRKYGLILVKLLISLVVVFSISQYFFNLVNQWLIVSLGKSLFIVGLLYVVKDIKGSKNEWLNRLGNLDDKMMATITDIFTTPGKFYLGFAFLLVLHYLTDLAVFFITFFISFVPVEPYYIANLPGPHTPLASLMAAEFAKAASSKATISLVYLMSAAGALVLFAIPVGFLLLVMLKIKFRNALSKRGHYTLLMLAFVSLLAFSLGPWVKSVSLYDKGIVGVDFVTNLISESQIPMTAILVTSVIALVLASLLFSRIEIYSRKISGYMALFVFLVGFFFFGQYVLNFFLSTFFYHLSAIAFFWKTQPILSIMFLFFLALEILFYIFGFFVLVFITSRYLVNQLISDLITDITIYIWTIMLLLVPCILLFMNPEFIVEALLVSVIFFIFTFAMYHEMHGGERRDDYLLGVSMIILAYSLVGFISSILSRYLKIPSAFELGLGEKTAGVFLEFLSPLLIVITTVYLLHYFGFRVRERFSFKINPFSAITAVFAGIFFGVWFYLTNEPNALFVLSTVGNKLLFALVVLLALVIAVSEEFLFRGLLFRLGKRVFSLRAALVLQAAVFTLIHYVASARLIWNYFSSSDIRLFHTVITPFGIPVFFFVYFISLFAFAYWNGVIAYRTKNLLYPIITHWIANTVIFTFLFFS